MAFEFRPRVMSSLNISELFSVKDRVAVVTGGASGLGFMICKGLVENGAKVYLCDLHTSVITDSVFELKRYSPGRNDAVQGVRCDVTSKESIQKLVNVIKEQETHVDILISNAGIRRDPPKSCSLPEPSVDELQASLWSSPWSDWTDSFNVNTIAHYFLSVAFLPLLANAAQLDLGNGRKGQDEGRGLVVMTSSCASMHNATNVDLTSYATTKAATDHLVKLLAAKFRNVYVRVVSINPGFVPSNMNPIGAAGNIFSNLFDQVPARRAGNDADIAGSVLYLASKAGSYIDGINLCIDGGRILVANGQT